MQLILKLFTGILLLTSCKKSSSVSDSPTASIDSNSKDRTVANSNIVFKVTLSKPATTAVTIGYNTVAGTAVENTDYIPATGMLSIPAGQTTGDISIAIKGDSTRKSNSDFNVHLSNPQNCSITKADATGTIVNENGTYLAVDNTGYSTPSTYPGYTLAWSDEFNGNVVDRTNWGYETGNGGWGNNELENYTSSTKNSFVSNGNLIIEARKEKVGTANYTSARMITKGRKDFKYGRIDIRAKLPKGQGIWPALWMLGSNIDVVSWPACGEIDMMELLGDNPSKMYSTLHWGGDGNQNKSKGTNYTLSGGSFDQQFHVYSMDWKQDSIKIFIDDVKIYAASSSDFVGATSNPFNNNFFFIFNIAVGGDWPGSPDATTVFPQRMVVDYVRVFQ